MASEFNTSAQYNYQSFTKSGIDFKDVISTFGGQNALRHTKGSRRTVLWEGFFGFFDGPEVARFHDKQTSGSIGTGNGKSIEINAQKMYKTIMGIRYDKKYTEYISFDGKGSALTALSAYVAVALNKRNTKHLEQVSITLPYSGPSLGDDSISRGIDSPYEVPGIHLRITDNERSYSYGRSETQPRLLYIGSVALTGNAAQLPETMAGQTRVLTEILQESKLATDEIAAMYGGNLEQITEIWRQSQSEKTPRAAAEFVLNELAA